MTKNTESLPEPLPLLNLRTQLKQYRADALAAISEVVDSQIFIQGPELLAFEKLFGARFGSQGVVGVSSGTDALLVALMALEIGPGDEVIIPAKSFFATAGVVARLGAKPVFVDVDPRSFNVDEAGVRAAITPATKAIIPVHLFGQAADLGSLYDDPNAPVIIEDSAQSLGTKFRGRETGQLGHIACTSFFPSKNLGGFGDGGAVYGRDEGLLERCRILRVHGAAPKYHHKFVGGNFRLDALQAAVLKVKLPYLDGWLEQRRRLAVFYDQKLTESGLTEEFVTLPWRHPEVFHTFNQYVIRVPRRDALKEALKERGIGTMVYYPSPLHLQPCFAELGHQAGDFPEAEAACAEVIALPICPSYGEAEVERVVNELVRFYQ